MSSIADPQKWREYIHGQTGIFIQEEKEYLFDQRLKPLLKKHQLQSSQELLNLAATGHHGVKEDIIHSMTTNETYFFRDNHPYELFKNHILPQCHQLILERKSRPFSRRGPKLSIWSAASSTGQEAFTMAMCIDEYCQEHPDIQKEDFSILATDISREVLAQAMQGQFSPLEIKRGLTQGHIDKYFYESQGKYCIIPKLLHLVQFKHFNLLDSFEQLGTMDVIYCRNVLIYFDHKTKTDILKKNELCHAAIQYFGGRLDGKPIRRK